MYKNLSLPRHGLREVAEILLSRVASKTGQFLVVLILDLLEELITDILLVVLIDLRVELIIDHLVVVLTDHLVELLIDHLVVVLTDLLVELLIDHLVVVLIDLLEELLIDLLVIFKTTKDLLLLRGSAQLLLRDFRVLAVENTNNLLEVLCGGNHLHPVTEVLPSNKV